MGKTTGGVGYATDRWSPIQMQGKPMAYGSLGARTMIFCASLQGHNHRSLDSRGARKFWPDPSVCAQRCTHLCVQGWVHEGAGESWFREIPVCKDICTSKRERATALGAHMPRCHQQGWLRSMSQTPGRLREDEHCIYTHIPTSRPSWPAKLLILSVFTWISCDNLHECLSTCIFVLHIYRYNIYMHVHTYQEYSLSFTTGWVKSLEVGESCFYQTRGSNSSS